MRHIQRFMGYCLALRERRPAGQQAVFSSLGIGEPSPSPLPSDSCCIFCAYRLVTSVLETLAACACLHTSCVLTNDAVACLDMFSVLPSCWQMTALTQKLSPVC